jgi:hypothetical protein
MAKQTLLERQILHRNGSVIPVWNNYKMVADGRMVTFVRNVSERKAIDELKKMHKKSSNSWNNTDCIEVDKKISAFCGELLAVPTDEFRKKIQCSEILPAHS